jgi:hypothetical protein
MTVLRAKVGGNWIDITGGGAAFVGPNDPGPSYNLWYDSDATNTNDADVARWNSAWGIVAVGIGRGAGISTPASTVTALTNPLAVTLQVGRRYRLAANVRAISNAGATAAAQFQLWDNGANSGGFDYWQLVPTGNYDNCHIDALLVGDGLAHSYDVRVNPGVAMSMWFDMATHAFYVEDIGPTSPAVQQPVVLTTPWQNIGPLLVNGWVNYGAPYGPAFYRLIGDVVELRGLISGSTPTAVICTLPVGYRPPYEYIYSCACGPGGTFVEVRISTAGVVTPVTPGPSAAPQSWMSLSQLRFSVTP